MSEEVFKVGDSVKQKSGVEPVMTVTSVSENELVCEWIADGKVNTIKCKPILVAKVGNEDGFSSGQIV